MTPDKVVVTMGGVLGILLTYWFFFMKPKRVVKASGEVTITVSGGYNPSIITLPSHTKTTLTFLRTDSNACLEEVILSDFKIRKYLPLNIPVSLTIEPEKTGEYEFSCGMNMNHGKIIVT